MKNPLYILIAIFTLIILGSMFVSFESDTEVPDDSEIPIENVFEKKVVYGTDATMDQDLLIADCDVRDGVFNTCGSACSSNTDICIEVCAFTCEFLDITNFEECANAGYPVMESYPRQCRVPGAEETFVEEIEIPAP